MMTLVDQLEDYGFQMPFTERLGPCDQCGTLANTYWLPSEKQWKCEECVYAN